jgi:hypothetical protein
LEIVTALLKELLILSSILGLLRLLFKRARTDLRLRPLQGRLLGSSTKASQLLRRSSPHAVALLTKRSKLLGGLRALTVLLLTKALNGLTDAKRLPIKPLTDTLHLLGSTKLLGISLLSKPGQLLARLLDGCAICLFSTQTHALLLLSSLERLLVSLLIQRSDSLSCREPLLTHQLGALKACAFTAKSTSTNSFGLLL